MVCAIGGNALVAITVQLETFVLLDMVWNDRTTNLAFQMPNVGEVQ